MVRSGLGSVRSAVFKFEVHWSSVSAYLIGKVAAAGSRPGPPTVLSVAEELPTEDVPVHRRSYYLGIERPQLKLGCADYAGCETTGTRSRETPAG